MHGEPAQRRGHELRSAPVEFLTDESLLMFQSAADDTTALVGYRLALGGLVLALLATGVITAT